MFLERKLFDELFQIIDTYRFGVLDESCDKLEAGSQRTRSNDKITGKMIL